MNVLRRSKPVLMMLIICFALAPFIAELLLRFGGIDVSSNPSL
jgi:hypothetical protein